ncbi:histone-lysine N-methyltransferase PRDM9-like [Mytilus trossulus]|uniref:histone-lysine N-methyltransferase PRDM9-like n=1 Tax=Mytilus trossulus TaxID=6551 RepID=UPI003004B3BE
MKYCALKVIGTNMFNWCDQGILFHLVFYYMIYSFCNSFFIECYKCFDPDLPVEHGLYVIKNVKTMIDNEDHVLATIPPGFSVRQSTIPNAGLGVFAETTIPNGTRLGPYNGALSKDFDGDDWTYIFLVAYDNGETKHHIDAKNKTKSSWLRYMNCARTIDEENLEVHQYNYEIYYVTNQCIKPGTELLVWYGDSYGELLGLERTSDDDDYAELSGKNIIVGTMNTIKEPIQRYSSSCYKLYEQEPFKKTGYSELCVVQKNFELCKFVLCERNPCSKQFDCNKCKGYCFHFGRYIKTNQEFIHTDNVNKCNCHMTGRWSCTNAHASVEAICTY